MTIQANQANQAGQQGITKAVDEFLVTPESEVTPVLSVVMPTLNEEKGIVECIDRIKTAISELRVPTEIIVSDSSTDATPELARERGATVVTPDEPGYGYAYRYAFDKARGEYIAMGDADTTYDFEMIPQLLEPVQNGDADICMGSRLEGEIRDGSMPPLHKYVGNPLLTRFLNTFYGAGVSDAHSGFRVFTKDALETLELETTGMEFASEMIMEAGANDLTIEEVPIIYHEREGEETLDSFSDGWRHVRFMLVNAPDYLFSYPALLLVSVGAVLMSLSIARLSIGGVNFGIQTMVGGSLLAIVGYQVWTLALFSSIAANPINKPEGVLVGMIRERFQLEHGASIGILAAAVGILYLGSVFGQWLLAGEAALPSATATLLASTVVVLGLQTVFGSFFMSMLADSS
ncbi:glycosyl transferase [Haloarcula hispanica N601]|uniref:Glycosyl transferase n=3 Tax=Haloarcula hispanica TaxID=51589 RepID=V5TL17_HALHI|nr:MULTISPECIES: glycosyltransferase family 2 protein [Haloarcula]AEM57240.1 dolichyl-phosphate beta-D-mannosyltransferase [Haloarcula hispanica ATCC 33960]AHB66021.1 glycosyl transferase [Haloarcula hispanica N601]AJF27154.1 glycosyl transferase [Haloarcula sp. CBA1115]KAA9407048.1 glycosyltransferase family 2 protein [Haloarcula sp. CBA1131]KAA9409919.1 glycosyltransferase family 2 protein [Haloarcula hispanica]